MWYKVKRILKWVNWEEKQIYPKVIKETYNLTMWDGTLVSIAKSWHTIKQIDIETTIRFTWSWQLYFRLCPTNSISSQNVISITASNLSRYGMRVQYGREGVAWYDATTVLSSMSTGVDYVMKATFLLDSWTVTVNWTTVNINYTNISSIISWIFNWATPYWQSAKYYSNFVSNPVTYTVTYN